jgi:ribonuclease BN (tRNA processing enzyme)
MVRATVGEYMAVKVTVVGCSPAWPNPGGAQSGYLVEGDGTRLLLDCGPGVLGRLREAHDGWPTVDAVVLTHFHLDHWGDLVPWVWGTLFGAAGERPVPELWLAGSGREQLAYFARRLGWEGMFEEAFTLRAYRDGTPFRVGALEVTPVSVPHYEVETYGFRVAHDGASLAYSGDSAPSARLVELARDADLFLCEATLDTAAGDGSPRGHLTVGEAVEAAREAGARRLVLTHRPAELGGTEGLELARDGLELEV